MEEAAAPDGGGWIFGQHGDGYVALYSHLPYEWQTEGPDADQEVIAVGMEVAYEAPGAGLVRFAWDGPLTVDGAEVPLRSYPRWENPYCRAEFDTTQFTITHAGKKLELDFEKNERTLIG